MTPNNFDLIVIGSGPAGTAAATVAASAGHKVALIEGGKLGGTCLNYGCDPTKTLLNTARLLYQAKQSKPFGLVFPQIDFEWGEVIRHVELSRDKMRGGSEEKARQDLKSQGIRLYLEPARFLSPFELKVGSQVLRGEKIVIATGARPAIPEIAGLKEAGFITNEEAVSLPTLPGRLAILGGGTIGFEFAQMLARFGVKVTILESGNRWLEHEDREMAGKLVELLQNEGISFELNARLEKVEVISDGKMLLVRNTREPEAPPQKLLVDEILVATGRQPNLEGLELEKARVEFDKRGIKVDDNLRTNVAHVYAAGDITGQFPFTHIAQAQGKIAGNNAFADKPEVFDKRAISWVTFTSPELAHLGQTEDELREAKINYRVGKQVMNEIPRAITRGEEQGLVKLLADHEGKLLGAHILNAEAGEMIAPLVLASQAGLKVTALAQTIFPYPTLAEAINQAALQLR